MKSRQICGLIAALTILTTATAMPLLIGLPISAHAQNTTATAPLSESQSTNPAQIKDYLTEAIKSLDSGNTTRALEQVDLAGDQLETLAGGNVSDDEEGGEVEEGSGEDMDEPGDIDDNDDKEDSP